MTQLKYLYLLLLLAMLPLAGWTQWKAGGILTIAQVEQMGGEECFKAEAISPELLARMRQGGSLPEGCSIKPSSLSYLRVLHYNFKGEIQMGELVCCKSIAADLLKVFTELYRNKYPIEKMFLVDNYGASDQRSMEDNNTSCFCFRRVSRSARLSKHAQGLAVDINPLNNPCVKYDAQGRILRIEPDTPESRKYAQKRPTLAHAINRNDICYKTFRKYGFTWGGLWRSKKDYQHFEK